MVNGMLSRIALRERLAGTILVIGVITDPPPI
jgi:hypothetical protein